MASTDPGRPSGSGVHWWRRHVRGEGSDTSSSSHDDAFSLRKRHHRRLARPCVANITGGGVGSPNGVEKGTDVGAVPTEVSNDRVNGAGRASAGDGGGGGGDTGDASVVSTSEVSVSTSGVSTTSYESVRKTHTRTRTPSGAIVLPLWEHRPGSVPQQYVLDGNKLRLLSPEEADAICESSSGSRVNAHSQQGTLTDGNTSTSTKPNVHQMIEQQRKRLERQVSRTKDSFLPDANSVSEDYWEYARFRFVQRVASSCISVFATQQMLQAVGLGATRRLPAAAAVNWVLKDGLGRLGKLSVATNFGREFDSDVKRFRFTSSVVYDASSLIEMITPFFPSNFLLLATIANVGKSVGITTANVVRAPIQRSFASDDNFAEITAKISAQQVLADNLGLALAVCATGLTGKLKAAGNARIILPLVAFIPLCSIDLYCIYRELKAVQLKTINRERGEIIAEGFVRNGKVPSFKVVADTERLLIPARLDESALPLRIRPLSEACPTVESLANALNNDPNTPYILSYLYPNESDNFRKKRVSERLGGFLAKVAKVFNGSDSSRNKKMKGHATLALAQHATSRDVMQAVLQVAHLRVLPFRKDLTQDEARVWALDESKRKSEQDVDAFISELHQNGWLSGKILLSSAERAPYRVDSGCVGVLGEGEDVLTK